MANPTRILPAYAYLIITTLLPSLITSLVAQLLFKLSPPIIFLSLVLTCVLPLAGYTLIYARFRTPSNHFSDTLGRMIDLLWVIPAAGFAAVSSVQRYLIIGLYFSAVSPSAGFEYKLPRGLIEWMYAVALLESLAVSRIIAMIWRGSKHIDSEEAKSLQHGLHV